MSAFILPEAVGNQYDDPEVLAAGHPIYEVSGVSVVPENADDTAGGARELMVMNGKLNVFIKEMTTIRGDISSIRVATHRGFQDLERQFRQGDEEIMAAAGLEAARHLADSERFEQRLVECSSCPKASDQPSAPTTDAFRLEIERRLGALETAIDRVALEEQIDALQEQVGALTLEQKPSNLEIVGRLDMLQEELRTLTLETEKRTLDLIAQHTQQPISSEMEHRLEALHEQIRSLTLDQQPISSDIEGRIDMLQEELRTLASESEKRTLNLVAQHTQQPISLEMEKRLDALHEQIRTLTLDQPISLEIEGRLAMLQEELRTLTLETDRRLETFLEDRRLEARSREKNSIEVTKQLLELSESTGKQEVLLAGLRDDTVENQARQSPGSAELTCRSGSVELADDLVTDVRLELASERSVRTKDMGSMAHQLKDLRLCLEAEVGARSAITERCSRELHECRSAIDAEKAERTCSTKASNESLADLGQALMSRMQMLEATTSSGSSGFSSLELEGSLQEVKIFREELLSRKEVDDKLQMLLDRQGQQRGASNLEVEILREGLNALEAQAKKYAAHVEAQAEKHAARQETAEKSIMQEAKARSALDEELRQTLVTELNTQAKFFQGELKGLMVSAHSTWVDEIAKIWKVVGKQGEERAGGGGSHSEPISTGRSRDAPQVQEYVLSGKAAAVSKKDLTETTTLSPAVPPPSAEVGGQALRSGTPIKGNIPPSPAGGVRVCAPSEAGLLGKSPPVSSYKNLPQNVQSAQRAVSGALPSRGGYPTRSNPNDLPDGRQLSPRQAHAGGAGSGAQPLGARAGGLLGQRSNAPAADGRQASGVTPDGRQTPTREQEVTRRTADGLRPGRMPLGPADPASLPPSRTSRPTAGTSLLPPGRTGGMSASGGSTSVTAAHLGASGGSEEGASVFKALSSAARASEAAGVS